MLWIAVFWEGMYFPPSIMVGPQPKYVEKILKGESVSHVEYIPPVPVFSHKRAMKYWNVEQELLPKKFPDTILRRHSF